MIPSQSLLSFISTGKKPSTEREVSALLDECRSALHQIKASYKTLEREGMKSPQMSGRVLVHPPSARAIKHSKETIAKYEAAISPASLDRMEREHKAAKHAKANAQAITASLMPAPQKPAAKPAPPSAKSIMAIFKAMPPGPARTAFYQKHRSILKP